MCRLRRRCWRRRGRGACATADGLGMLLHQAVGGFALWFGVTPDVTPNLRALVEADLVPKEPKEDSRIAGPGRGSMELSGPTLEAADSTGG